MHLSFNLSNTFLWAIELQKKKCEKRNGCSINLCLNLLFTKPGQQQRADFYRLKSCFYLMFHNTNSLQNYTLLACLFGLLEAFLAWIEHPNFSVVALIFHQNPLFPTKISQVLSMWNMEYLRAQRSMVFLFKCKAHFPQVF